MTDVETPQQTNVAADNSKTKDSRTNSRSQASGLIFRV